MLLPLLDKTSVPNPGPGSPAAGIAIVLVLALALYAAIGLTVWMVVS